MTDFKGRAARRITGHRHLPLAAVLALVVSALTGCGMYERFAIAMAPDKTPMPTQSDLAERATEQFWQVFQSGDYDRLPEVRRLLTAAYLENPRSPQIALLLGHTHFWALAERTRLDEIPPSMADRAVLTEKYLAGAWRMSPDDWRIPGWLGSARLAVASLHQDEAQRREGYFLLDRGYRELPEFNGFSKSFALSAVPRDHERFPEVVEAIWKNGDECVGGTLDRDNPVVAPIDERDLSPSQYRFCSNSDMAPHNREGFWLHFGDVLVKQGDWERAEIVYANARTVPDFERWPFAEVLNERIARARENSARFANGDQADDPQMMLGSTYACTGCHQAAPGDRTVANLPGPAHQAKRDE